MPSPGRRLPSAFAATLLLAVGCGRELPPESGTATATAAPVRSRDDAPATGCEQRTPAERLETLRRGVAALPAAASLAGRSRLTPQLGAVAQALGRGEDARAAEGLQAFIADIVELRLRAPFEERVVLASEAQCLLDALNPAAVGEAR